MDTIRKALKKLLEKEDLAEEEIFQIFLAFSKEQEVSPILASSFLTALHIKGETVEELVGASKAMLRTARSLPVNGDHEKIMDIVGTGGDGKQTCNISTLASFTAAACGVSVVKHGNRSISSRCGSADLIEKLGLRIEQDPEKAAEQLHLTCFAFLFAPFYHFGFKQIGEIRKALGFRTIFNRIGHLVNPARPSVMLLGVAHPSWLLPTVESLKKLGCQRAWVVHGGGGSDELDLEGDNLIFSLENGKIDPLKLSPSEVNLKGTSLSKIQGGTKSENLSLAIEVLQGKPGPLSDVTALNSGASLYLYGKAKTVREGVDLAKDVLRKGLPWSLVEKIRSEYSE